MSSKNVWMTKAYATCSDCNFETGGNNAMGVMAKHCKKNKHNGEVTMQYALHYKEEANS